MACTRAQDSLVVTAVANAGQSATSGEQPSRFLAELTGDGTTVRTTHEPGYQLSSLNMSSVVAALRATLEAPDSSEGLKQAAAARLAQLAHGGVGAADPRRWWGLADWTHSGREVRPSGEPLRISGSSWSQLDRCSLAWFLQHEAQATTPGTTATAFGSVIHELADAVTRGTCLPIRRCSPNSLPPSGPRSASRRTGNRQTSSVRRATPSRGSYSGAPREPTSG